MNAPLTDTQIQTLVERLGGLEEVLKIIESPVERIPTSHNKPEYPDDFKVVDKTIVARELKSPRVVDFLNSVRENSWFNAEHEAKFTERLLTLTPRIAKVEGDKQLYCPPTRKISSDPNELLRVTRIEIRTGDGIPQYVVDHIRSSPELMPKGWYEVLRDHPEYVLTVNWNEPTFMH